MNARVEHLSPLAALTAALDSMLACPVTPQTFTMLHSFSAP
jgi:hypothetical protein